jgi:predicted enzyme related to lactoylglutathione lyase
MAKVTGIGGVFIKSKGDEKALAQWYSKHLGFTLEPWGGSILKWPDDKGPDRGLTVWHVAEKDGTWFSPSTSSFMINYRVDDMEALLARLRKDGIEILKGPQEDFNGSFAWIMDPEGNKVELWQPKGGDEKPKARKSKKTTAKARKAPKAKKAKKVGKAKAKAKKK